VLLLWRPSSASRRVARVKRVVCISRHRFSRSTQFHATTSNAMRRAASRRRFARKKKRSAFPREIASCARPGLLASHYLLSASRRPSCDNRAPASDREREREREKPLVAPHSLYRARNFPRKSFRIIRASRQIIGAREASSLMDLRAKSISSIRKLVESR